MEGHLVDHAPDRRKSPTARKRSKGIGSGLLTINVGDYHGAARCSLAFSIPKPAPRSTLVQGVARLEGRATGLRRDSIAATWLRGLPA